MRPKPESPLPPNGSAGTLANVMTELIEVIPLRRARATASPRLAFLLNTAEPSA